MFLASSYQCIWQLWNRFLEGQVSWAGTLYFPSWRPPGFYGEIIRPIEDVDFITHVETAIINADYVKLHLWAQNGRGRTPCVVTVVFSNNSSSRLWKRRHQRRICAGASALYGHFNGLVACRRTILSAMCGNWLEWAGLFLGIVFLVESSFVL